MKNGVMTNQEIKEKLEYERAKELFPDCKDLERKGRLWKIISDYNKKKSQKPLPQHIVQRDDR